MAFNISPDDKAADLWRRVKDADLTKIWGSLDNMPVPVGEISDRLGLSVVSLTLAPEISGLIRKTAKGEYEIQVNNTDAPVRQRFTVCHEIAHYLLHRELIDSDGITDNTLYRSKLSNRQEAEANRLGAAILLPWPKMYEWHKTAFGGPPDKKNLDKIAAAFRASTLAVGFRLGI